MPMRNVKEISIVRRFWRDERGAQSIEMVLMSPLLIAMVLITVDVTSVYQMHSEMWNVARDTARRMAARQLPSKEDAEAYAETSLTMFQAANYTISATYDLDGDMTVTISAPISEVVAFGSYFVTALDLDAPIVSFSRMRTEPVSNFNPSTGPGTGGGPADPV